VVEVACQVDVVFPHGCSAVPVDPVCHVFWSPISLGITKEKELNEVWMHNVVVVDLLLPLKVIGGGRSGVLYSCTTQPPLRNVGRGLDAPRLPHLISPYRQ
jgi:hypothetical protein